MESYATHPPKEADASAVAGTKNFAAETIIDIEGDTIPKEKMLSIDLVDGRRIAAVLACGEGAVLSHKTDRINWVTVGAEVAVPGPGLFGGYPTSTNTYRLIKGADVHGYMERTGRTPSEPEELSGETDWVSAKSFDRFTERDDLWIFSWAGAGGYGDPHARERALVQRDLAEDRISAQAARDLYGLEPQS